MNTTSVRVSSYISGIGMYVPERVIPNSHFVSYLDTSDEWIRDRTGITERRWVEPQTPMSAVAEPAARAAIKQAGLTPADINGIICATVTPDYLFPGGACCLQQRLGVSGAFAFDLNAVCSGFIYGLATADSMIASGMANHILVVGADIFSTVVDPQDRSTCVLFGDGAGAVVVSSVTKNKSERYTTGSIKELSGIYGSELHADGTQGPLLCVQRGTATNLTAQHFEERKQFLRMAGREVFKLAVRSIVEVSESLLDRLGINLEDVDYVLCHQANKRILAAVAEQLKLPDKKFLMNIEKYGNTSAASVPLLLADSWQNGRVKKGDLILFNAFGGGLTWAASLVRL